MQPTSPSTLRPAAEEGTGDSSPSARCCFEALDTELIAPSLEALAGDALEFQIVERFLQRNRFDQRRQFAIQQRFIATLDQCGRQLRCATRLDRPSGPIRRN